MHKLTLAIVCGGTPFEIFLSPSLRRVCLSADKDLAGAAYLKETLILPLPALIVTGIPPPFNFPEI